MKFTSTRSTLAVDSLPAILRGLAPDGGLFVPASPLPRPVSSAATLADAERLALGAFFDDVPETVREDAIRNLFASLPDAKTRGYGPGRFSFNTRGGRCEACSGDGMLKIEMHFLADVYVPCEVCHGKRYNRETLEVKYRGKSIADVLDMTAEEALDFFAPIPRIADRLRTLCEVGLGYVKLGQSSTTLSGGEAQRVKLATELSKRSTGSTVYVLDEPTTGLHIADVHKLIDILNRLTDAGNTVVVIEHNLDVIKVADHIIDLGPEGGDGGGNLVFAGTPEDCAKCDESFTGQFLKPILH